MIDELKGLAIAGILLLALVTVMASCTITETAANAEVIKVCLERGESVDDCNRLNPRVRN